MVQSETAFGGLVNRRLLPTIFLGLGILLVLLTFAVGWFSVDAKLRRWQYDPENPEGDYVGPPAGPLSRIDLEMHMLSMKTSAAPAVVENAIAAEGAPTYDEHAGRMGTVMLGVLLMQLAVLFAFVATAAFYLLQRGGKHDYSGVTKRLFIVLFTVLVVSLLYFALRIGPAAQEDEKVILEEYRFSEQVAYAPPKPELGFWKQWTSERTSVNLPGDNRQVWEIEVISRPSAGFWLSLASFGFSLGARVVAGRNGDFGTDSTLEPPPPPPRLSPS